MLQLLRALIHIQVNRMCPAATTGRPRRASVDEILDAIMHVVRTGCQWRSLRPGTVSHITVFKSMHRWMRMRVFENAYQCLLSLYARRRRPKYYCIDSSFVKSIYGRDCVGRNPTDRGRKASKLSVVVDDRGVLHALHSTAANCSDMKLLRFGSSEFRNRPLDVTHFFSPH